MWWHDQCASYKYGIKHFVEYERTANDVQLIIVEYDRNDKSERHSAQTFVSENNLGKLLLKSNNANEHRNPKRFPRRRGGAGYYATINE